MMAEKQEFRIKGWHVFAGFAAAFGVIITVNVVMATKAITTFPGLEVRNGYIASQSFDDRRAAQEALGWDVRVEAEAGMLRLAFTDADGRPVQVGNIAATVGRPTEAKDDFTPEFVFDGSLYSAPVDLGAGKWILRLTAQSLDGVPFEQRLDVHVIR